MNNVPFNFLAMNTQVDMTRERMDDMVQTYIDPTNYIQIDTSKRKKLDLFMHKAHVELDDNQIKLFRDTKNFTVNEFDHSQTHTELIDVEKPEYATIYLRTSQSVREYNRSVGSMLDFLGDTGGLFEIVALFVYVIIKLVVERNFRAAIISDAYKVQKYNRDQSEYYVSETAHANDDKHELTLESNTSSNESLHTDSENKSYASAPEDKSGNFLVPIGGDSKRNRRSSASFNTN